MKIETIVTAFLTEHQYAEKPICMTTLGDNHRIFDTHHIALKNLHQTLSALNAWGITRIQVAFAMDKDLTLRFQYFDSNKPIQTLIPIDERQPCVVEAIVMGVMLIKLGDFITIEKIHCLQGIPPQQLMWLFLAFRIESQHCQDENKPYCYFSHNLKLTFGSDPQTFFLDSIDILMASLKIIPRLPHVLVTKLHKQQSKIIHLCEATTFVEAPSAKRAKTKPSGGDEDWDSAITQQSKRPRLTFFEEDSSDDADDIFDLPPGYQFRENS